MNIVIHRQKMENVLEESKYLFDKLRVTLGEHLKVSHNGLVMGIFDIDIQFRCGEVCNLRGLRPDIYNTDSASASNFLQQSAVKVGGKELDTLDNIYLEIVQHCMDIFIDNIAVDKSVYDSLSEEEKKAFVELCKEDPVIFVERVVGVELKDYQKVYIRETFKRLQKEKTDDAWKAYFQQEPIEPRCEHCNNTGLIPFGPGVRGLMKCPYCDRKRGR